MPDIPPGESFCLQPNPSNLSPPLYFFIVRYTIHAMKQNRMKAPIDPTAIKACSEAGLRPEGPGGGPSLNASRKSSSSSNFSRSYSWGISGVAEVIGSNVGVVLIILEIVVLEILSSIAGRGVRIVGISSLIIPF